MTPPYICSACRRRLSQFRPKLAFQWRSRANFISLSKGSPEAGEDKRSGAPPKKRGNEQKVRDDRLPSRTYEWNEGFRRSRKRSPGDVLETLFEESLRPSPTSTRLPAEALTVLEPYKKVEFLKKLLAQGGNAADSWFYFVEHFGPDVEDAHGRRTLPSYLTTTARELMKQINYEKEKKPLSYSLPSATEVSKVYLLLGLLHGHEWSSMVSNLLENILKRRQLPNLDPAEEERLVLDLLGAWNIVCRAPRDGEGLPEIGSADLDWTHIPSTPNLKGLERLISTHGHPVAFSTLVSIFSVRELGIIPYVACATFRLLLDRESKKMTPLDAAPLIKAFAQVISLPGLDLTQAIAPTRGSVPPLVLEYVCGEWQAIKQQASLLSQPAEPLIKRPGASRGPCLRSRLDMSSVTKRLHDAVMRRNSRQIDEIWAEARDWPTSKENDAELLKAASGSSRGFLAPRLYNHFIMAYMAVRQPNRAVEVWNHMVQNEIAPSLESWTAMMSGCKLSRDWKASERIWGRMQSMQIQPDSVCWTTRISVLVESNRADDAIRALDEMGRLWIAAAKKQHNVLNLSDLLQVNDVDGAVKPTIVTINALVAGLLRRQNQVAAHRILSWAGKFGISPDVVTYNTLLRPLVREGKTKAMLKILEEMQRAGVQADVATYTTILEETLRRADQYTVEQQGRIVDAILQEMEAAGIEANLHTYAKIIYDLLQGTTDNMSVINTILERMASQGLKPSTHINTMLVSHYLSRSPPDLTAAQGVIDLVSMERGSVDHVFWDRVIEGYARAGETGSAIKFLERVTSQNEKISWLSMGELITALAVSDEWDAARTIVRDAAVKRGGPLPDDVRGEEGQHKFWRLANELQLLGPGPVPTADASDLPSS